MKEREKQKKMIGEFPLQLMHSFFFNHEIVGKSFFKQKISPNLQMNTFWSEAIWMSGVELLSKLA